MTAFHWRSVFGLVAVCGLAPVAAASFHIMQIEQVMIGLDGDMTVQAVQLRMRGAGQNQLQFAKLIARDASGAHPITVIDFATSVPVSAAGSRILIASPNFASHTTPAAAADYTMTNLIPASYANGGRLTFESDAGVVYWSLSWGSYTGSNAGDATNDADRNFGPPVAGAFPVAGTSALRFTGSATAMSTRNIDQYAAVTRDVTFVNNAGTSFLVVLPRSCFADYNQDGGVDGSDVDAFYADWEAGNSAADTNQDGGVDGADVEVFFSQWEAGGC